MEICDKLLSIRPGAHWNLRGDTYEGLEWLDDPSTKPTAIDLGL
jgi:hypothetical protein